MPIPYILSFPEIIIESILFTSFLSRRMECKKPFAFHLPDRKPSLKRHGRFVPNSESALWDARAWKAAFCCLIILASSMVHIFFEGKPQHRHTAGTFVPGAHAAGILLFPKHLF